MEQIDANVGLLHEGVHSLIPLQGSFSWFLCGHNSSPQLQPNVSCPDPSSLVIYTRHQTFELNVANLTNEGLVQPLVQEINITVIHSGFNVTTSELFCPRNNSSVCIIPVEGLEEDGRSIVRASTLDWTQEVLIERDVQRPQIDMTMDEVEDNEEVCIIRLTVAFNTYDYATPRNGFCQADLRPLSESYSAGDMLSDSAECDRRIDRVDLASVLDIVPENITRSQVVNVFSGTTLYARIRIFLDSALSENVTLTIPAGAIMDRAGNMNESNETRTASCGLTGVSERSEQDEESEQGEESNQNSIEKWRPFSSSVVGELCVIVAASSIVISFTASVISSSLGSEMNPGAMKLLGYSQKLYMTGRLAVADMPLTYRNFTDNFDWVMLDTAEMITNSCKSPPPNVKRPSRGLLDTADALNIVFREGRLTASKKHFNRVVFWTPIIFMGVLLIHFISVSAFFAWKRDIPPIFHFPRLEIMFGYFCTPIIVMASSAIYRNREHALLATWMLIAFPVSFLCWNVSVVWNNFFSTPLAERKAHMFVDLGEHFAHDSNFLRRAVEFFSAMRMAQGATTQRPTGLGTETGGEIQMSRLPQTPLQHSSFMLPQPGPLEDIDDWRNEGEEEEEESETSSPTTYTPSLTASSTTPLASSVAGFRDLYQCIFAFFNATVFAVMLGRRQPKSQWTGIQSRGTAFVSKYGYLFEDYRGPPVVREEATYEYDPESGTVNRGDLVLAGSINFVQVPCTAGDQFRIYPFHAQLFMKMFELIKLIVLGSLVGAVGNGHDSWAEMLSLLCLSLTTLVAMRLTKPFLNRLDMTVGLCVESADFLVFLCMLIITKRGSCRHKFKEEIGVIMLVAQCLALAFMIVRYAFVSMYVTITCMTYRKQAAPSKLSNVLDMVFRVRFPVYFEHKYFDRWMVKVLHKGLHGRPLKLSELPRSVAIRMLSNRIRHTVVSVFCLRGQTNQ